MSLRIDPPAFRLVEWVEQDAVTIIFLPIGLQDEGVLRPDPAAGTAAIAQPACPVQAGDSGPVRIVIRKRQARLMGTRWATNKRFTGRAAVCRAFVTSVVSRGCPIARARGFCADIKTAETTRLAIFVRHRRPQNREREFCGDITQV